MQSEVVRIPHKLKVLCSSPAACSFFLQDLPIELVLGWGSGGGASGRAVASCLDDPSLILLGVWLFCLSNSNSGASLIRSLVEVQC